MGRNTDQYPKDMNLKESLQLDRGDGKRLVFQDSTYFPSNFGNDFLRNSENKRHLYPYLIDKIISKTRLDNKVVIGTRNEKVVMNHKGILLDIIVPDCYHAEVDTRIVMHVINCLQNGIKHVTVRSNDTDVVVLLVAYYPEFAIYSCDAYITAMCGVGKKVEYLSIKNVALHIGFERCRELLFFHALTGSDFTSSFFQIGKCKWWDAWIFNGNISKTFTELSTYPDSVSPEHIKDIEKFVISVYDPNLNGDSID